MLYLYVSFEGAGSMRNLSRAWARGAQVGTLAVLFAGCPQSEKDEDGSADAMVEEDAGLPMCRESLRAEVGTCVKFDGLEDGQDDYPPTFSGVVEAIERPERICTGLGNAARSNADEQGYAITIRDGDTVATVALHLPWRTPFVSVGDTVSVEYASRSGVESGTWGSLLLRSADGELLFWFATTPGGFDDLDPPETLSVRDGDPTCTSGGGPSCSNIRHDLIAESDDSGDVSIAFGEAADVGDFVVLHRDNTTSSCDGATRPYAHSVTLAAMRGSHASLDARDMAE